MVFSAAPHRRHPPTRRRFAGSGPSTRPWLAAGLCGALFVAALTPLWDVWTVNVAGVKVNRAILAQTVTEGSPAEKDLAQAMELMESVAARGPHTAAREIPIWRTYGAAASLLPSDHAFELLARSRNAGRLDRVGELWLGEVAASTKHWDVAENAYMRIDASNLLIHRAETSLQAGDKELALLQFRLAKKSLDAATERATAEELLLDRAGSEPPATSRLMRQPGERATSLYQIGRGIMNAGQPEEAASVLEEALAATEADSPGIVTQQSIILGLGLALARTFDSESETAHRFGQPTYFELGDQQRARVQAHIRVRTLAYLGVHLDTTAAACVQAGRIMLLAGEKAQGGSYLEQALDLDPRLPEAYLVLGQWYESQNLAVRARSLYEKGAEMLPANVELAGAHAMAAYDTLPPQEALPLLKRAADMSSTDPFVFAFLGDCYADLGLISQARAAYLEGLRGAPGTEALTERLSQLPNVLRILP
jgi:tetratricopeptide (TPR) repeat protein